MSDIKSQLATFRVEPELWKAFKAQARKDGRTASEVLNEFVQSYIQTRAIAPTEVSQPVLDNLESRIDEKVVEALAPIRAELQELQLRLGGSELGELAAALSSKKEKAAA